MPRGVYPRTEAHRAARRARKPWRLPIPACERAEMVRGYHAGHGMNAIGDVMGYSNNTIRRVLLEEGVAIRAPSRAKAPGGVSSARPASQSRQSSDRTHAPEHGERP